MTRTLVALVLIVASGVAFGQSHQPYAGMEQRAIKALSEQQIADLRAGRGMGLALPAELNGYPGPLHVLEHADALGLSVEQRQRTTALFEAMKAEAVPVGERLIEQEARLDRLFAAREVNAVSLAAVTDEIGATQARLRQAHLKYHLAMMDVLSPGQVEHYRHLRGYGAKSPGTNPHHGPGPHRHH
jgi:Spy/CpxP family protein refolding chaperone